MMLQWREREIDLEFEENVVNVLVLEDSKTFSEFLNGIFCAIGMTQESFVLYENDKTLNVSKNVEIIFSPLLLDVNSKRIQTQLFQELKIISDEMCYELKEKANSIAVSYLDELSKKVPYPIKFSLDLDENTLYKQYNVRLDFEDESLLDKTINYIQLENTLCGMKLFVLVNCKAYFSKSELRELYKSAFYNKVAILMVENVEMHCLPEEKYYIMDKDQCLIMHE